MNAMWVVTCWRLTVSCHCWSTWPSSHLPLIPFVWFRKDLKTGKLWECIFRQTRWKWATDSSRAQTPHCVTTSHFSLRCSLRWERPLTCSFTDIHVTESISHCSNIAQHSSAAAPVRYMIKLRGESSYWRHHNPEETSSVRSFIWSQSYPLKFVFLTITWKQSKDWELRVEILSAADVCSCKKFKKPRITDHASRYWKKIATFFPAAHLNIDSRDNQANKEVPHSQLQ
jgi:hypothetical protein